MATRNKVEILIDANATRARNQINAFGRDLTGTFSRVKSSVSSLQGKVAMLAGGAGLGMLGKSFLDAARTSENLQTRLEVLTGSTQEGARMFQLMSQYASRVPFQYRDIMEASATLSGVLEGNVDQVNAWMPLIGDLAAATGLTIQQTTEQVNRMLSAGAASADLFRERGVLAMLGFQSGVSYSAEETSRRLIDAWKDPESRFRGATQKMATDFDGTVSMIQDKWFQLRNKVMQAGVFDAIKEELAEFDEKFGEWLERNDELIAQKVPEYIDKIKSGLEATWAFISENKEIIEFGIVGMAIWGKRGAVLAAGAVTAAKALAEAHAGPISVHEREQEAIKAKRREIALLAMGVNKLKSEAQNAEIYGQGGGLIGKLFGKRKDYDALVAAAEAKLSRALQQLSILEKSAGMPAGPGAETPTTSAETPATAAPTPTPRIDTAASEAKAQKEAEIWLNQQAAYAEHQQALADMEKERLETQEELRASVTDRINQLTLSEWDYKRWALEQETEAMRAKAEGDMELEQQIADYKLARLQEIEEAEAAAAEAKKKRVAAVVQAEADQRAAARRQERQLFLQRLQDVAQYSEAAFRVSQAAAVANTVVSTYEAAQDAYKAMAGIPVVGPALGAAAAAAAIAAGMARVAAIKEQKPAQYAEGGLVSQPTLAWVGEAGPEAVIPLSSDRRDRALELLAQIAPRFLGAGGRSGGGSVTVNVEFTGPVHLSGDQEQIKNAIGYAIADAVRGAM